MGNRAKRWSGQSGQGRVTKSSGRAHFDHTKGRCGPGDGARPREGIGRQDEEFLMALEPELFEGSAMQVGAWVGDKDLLAYAQTAKLLPTFTVPLTLCHGAATGRGSERISL